MADELENNDNELVEGESTKYTEPVLFTVGGVDIGWHPESFMLIPDYESDKAIQMAQTIQDLIFSLNDNGYIRVTPEGPTFESNVQDLGAVVWAINYLYADEGIEVKGNAPTLADFGLDDASNYNEDGTELVR